MPSISHTETADILTAPPAEGSDPDPVRRVVLIDSRPERRAVMGVLVDQCPGLIMVGVAADLDGAATRIREQRADVAIVEIQMPVAEGLATIGALREQFPHLRIVVCSFHDDAATRQAAQTHGADAYLSKPLSARDLFALTVDPHAPLVGSTTP